MTGWVCSKNPPLDPNQNSQGPHTILATIQSIPTETIPGGTAVIQAYLMDQSGQPAAGSLVEFSTTMGSCNPDSISTNESGIATTTFTAPQNTGSAIITASLDSTQTKTVTVDVKNTTPQSTTIGPEHASILANGESSTKILSIWLTEENQPLKGIPITFETTAGSITSPIITDSSGIAIAILTSIASRINIFAQITAQGSGTKATTQVLFKGLEFTLDALPVNLIADGRSMATITAVLKETNSHIAISDALITFGANLGTIPNAATTNSSGVAKVNLTSEPQTGTSTVTATYGLELIETVQVQFGESRPTYLNVSAEPPVIMADNQSTSKITAMVSDQTNNPVSDGTQVIFDIIDGTGTIASNQVTVGGVASSTLTSSTQPDTVTIVVQVDQLSDTTTVLYIVGEPATISVTADSSSLPADGITSTRVIAYVFDVVGHAVVDGTRVTFGTDIGDITPTVQTTSGQAEAKFTSSITGIATIRASVGDISDELTILLRPGLPNSILLSYNPTSIGVKDSGRNQTLTITAEVLDSKNNPVIDGTFVLFSIYASPGGGEFLSSDEPIPTLNGKAHISLNSGIRSGTVRILARVLDESGVPLIPEVRALSTDIIIFAGPPYFENVNDRGTSHLSVGVEPLNVYGWHIVNNTATVTVVVGDKYNNPVPPGTAVYFTTTAGVISTYAGYTDAEGVATVTIHTGQPYPTINRFYETYYDPNYNYHPDFINPAIIPGPIPDFELSEVINSVGGLDENDGIVRILAVTEGVDADSNSTRIWSVTNLVFSGRITTFNILVSKTVLHPTESAFIDFQVYDINGNPIVPGSVISITAEGGKLSWSSMTTDDPGITHYQVILTNNIDPNDPEAKPVTTPVTILVESQNGRVLKMTHPIHLLID